MQTLFPRSWYHAFFLHANSPLPYLVVAAGLHDLLQRLFNSVPIVRLCGKGQSKSQSGEEEIIVITYQVSRSPR